MGNTRDPRHLINLYNKYQNSNFVILGISLDRDKATLTEFLEQREMRWPQILLDKAWEDEIMRLYNVIGIPRMYLISPAGFIISRDLRGVNMVSEIQKLVSEYSTSSTQNN